MKLQQLLESLSSIVYHATTLKAAFDIIKNGKFLLSNSIGNSGESRHAPNDYHFYLSTTRTKMGSFHNDGGSHVVFVLDGDYYNNRYKSKPISFWGVRNRFGDGSSEAEDRIFSKTNSLPIDGIREIHVLYDEANIVRSKGMFSKNTNSLLREMLLECKRHNIKTYLYDNFKNWVAQDKTKTINLKDSIGYAGKSEFKDTKPFNKRYDMKHPTEITAWVELLYKKSMDELTPDAEELCSRIINRPRSEFEPFGYLWRTKSSQRYEMIPGEVESVAKIVAYMTKQKLKTPKDFFDAMVEKWSEIDRMEN